MRAWIFNIRPNVVTYWRRPVLCVITRQFSFCIWRSSVPWKTLLTSVHRDAQSRKCPCEEEKMDSPKKNTKININDRNWLIQVTWLKKSTAGAESTPRSPQLGDALRSQEAPLSKIHYFFPAIFHLLLIKQNTVVPDRRRSSRRISRFRRFPFPRIFCRWPCFCSPHPHCTLSNQIFLCNLLFNDWAETRTDPLRYLQMHHLCFYTRIFFVDSSLCLCFVLFIELIFAFIKPHKRLIFNLSPIMPAIMVHVSRRSLFGLRPWCRNHHRRAPNLTSLSPHHF